MPTKLLPCPTKEGLNCLQGNHIVLAVQVTESTLSGGQPLRPQEKRKPMNMPSFLALQSRLQQYRHYANWLSPCHLAEEGARPRARDATASCISEHHHRSARSGAPFLSQPKDSMSRSAIGFSVASALFITSSLST